MHTFLRAFQARKIDRVAAAYAVAAWLLVQGASIAFPAFEAPAWALRAFIVALIAGFPAALAIAWFAAADAQADDAQPGAMSHREVVLLALLAVVLLLSAGELVFVATRAPSGPARTGSAPAQASIAVLPFENLSSDKDAGYFAAGIQDEILTRLAKIGALKVISRTSTDRFANKPDNLPEIGRELGVANILEGSVQKAGNAVHINVQLINAANDDHLWAEIYDRKLDDIFGVEAEVATTIAQTLNAKVTGSEKQSIEIKPTNNPEAYDAYLRGLTVYGKTTSEEGYKTAQQFLEQAVRLDPGFAVAWALLAQVDAIEFFSGHDTGNARRDAAHAALDAAIRLHPDLAEVELAQAYYQYWVERDYENARLRFEQLRGKSPNNVDVLHALALITRRLGRWDESRAYFMQASTLDPLTPDLRKDTIDLLSRMRDFPAALPLIDDALNKWPDDLDFISDKAVLYQELGRLDDADAVLKGAHPEPSDFVVNTMFDQARFRRRYPEEIGLLRQLLQVQDAHGATDAMSGFLSTDLGDMLRLSGDTAGARASYIRARDTLLAVLKDQPDNSYITASLAWVYCGLGDREVAMRYAERAIDQQPVSKDALDGADNEQMRAQIEAGFGDRDSAIPALARLLKLPSNLTPAILRFDPNYDRLRGDPRFEALENTAQGTK